MLLVLTTVSNFSEAEILAEKIVNAKLAGCVQIVPQMTSIYIWQGKLQRETECLLVIKTLPEKYDELSEYIATNHNYDTPEIVAIETEKASEHYARWLESALN